MRYREAIGYLYQLAPRGIELGLARMEQALALRGHPERACPAVLVAGTNGKGSVATMIASVLQQSGQRVGLFTSPHLHRFVERFRIAGRPVSEAALARKITLLRPFLEAAGTPPLTFFEACTLIAFELFREARCDVIVLEVGLGGRLDSTNVVTPRVAVITSVARDHTDRLGEKISQIAREKAGILKPGVAAVTGVRVPEARAVIRRRARTVGAPLAVIDHDFAAQPAARGFDVRVGERVYPRLSVPLGGAFQADNLACAVAALDALSATLPIDARAVALGLSRVRWPGRLELLPGAPDVLCDAAHNPHAAEALAAHLRMLAPRYPRRVLLFGVMRDKEHARMLAILEPEVDACVFTSAATARAMPARELVALHGGTGHDDPHRALAAARKRAGKRGLVVACGSIYAMALVRAEVLGLRADPTITF
ncbi:MAG: folylpolyglutamate synthase/dihydrofolate synthase family protein [Polyangiales bacterium]